MPGLYLHIPFCLSKCPYCDFFSLGGDDAAVSAYVALLGRELEQKSADWHDPFDTLFFGGGTPSRLSPGQVSDLLQTVRSRYGLTRDAGLTLEANPGTISDTSLQGYRAAGINRLSLGIQSFDDRFLRALGREHDSAQAIEAFQIARRAGFSNLSCDLMFALPGQSPADLDRDLDRLLELAPEHVSAYALTLEEGTPLFHRHQQQPLPLPDDEQGARLFRQVHRRLTAAGYRHYEISNYALPGHPCRHNQNTWRRDPYLGVGAGAHSFLARGWGERRATPADLDHYRDALDAGVDPSQLLETFDRAGAMSETVYLGRRTAAGVDGRVFRERFGTTLEEAFAEAAQACGETLQSNAHHWRFTLDGWLLFDHLIQPFLQ